jgi:hypothetical protein
MTRKPNFLDHEELASIHKLHREGKLDKAAKILLREELIPASVWQRVIESASITQQIGQQLAEINRINFSIDFSHIYATLNNIDTSSMRRAFNVSSEVVKLMQSLDVWQESYFQEIVKITDSLNEVTRRVSADLAAFQLAFQDIISSDIISDLIKLWEETEDAKEAFREAGWPITPSMTKQVKDRVVELHKQGKTGYASQVILGYYRRKNYQNLKLAIESWENHSLFKPRMHIIQDAFEAHCSGLYTLSVPALLPLVEGILLVLTFSVGSSV